MYSPACALNSGVPYLTYSQFARFHVVRLRSEDLSGEEPGLWIFHLPLFCTSKSSPRTLRSPTLHLRRRMKRLYHALKKLIPEDGKLDVSQRAYDTVMAPFFFIFYHIMKGTPLDPLLRVNNPSPQCCHRADGYLDIVLCKREKVVCSNISECGWDVTQFFLFVVFIPKLSSFRAKHLGCE